MFLIEWSLCTSGEHCVNHTAYVNRTSHANPMRQDRLKRRLCVGDQTRVIRVNNRPPNQLNRPEERIVLYYMLSIIKLCY